MFHSENGNLGRVASIGEAFSPLLSVDVMAAISLSDILEIIIVAALGAYFIVGLGVVLFLTFRGPKMSLWPRNGMLWEKKDHQRNIHWWINSFTLLHPVGFILHLVFWPVWFMSYLDSLEAEEEETSQYLGPPDDDPPRGQNQV